MRSCKHANRTLYSFIFLLNVLVLSDCTILFLFCKFDCLPSKPHLAIEEYPLYNELDGNEGQMSSADAWQCRGLIKHQQQCNSNNMYVLIFAQRRLIQIAIPGGIIFIIRPFFFLIFEIEYHMEWYL